MGLSPVLSEDETAKGFSKTLSDLWSQFFLSTFCCKLACSPWHPLRWRPKRTWIHLKRLRPTPSLQIVSYGVNEYTQILCITCIQSIILRANNCLGMVDGALHLRQHLFPPSCRFCLEATESNSFDNSLWMQ